MATTEQRAGIPRYREWQGMALFRQGFRPFFLAAGAGAVLLLAGWLSVLGGGFDLPSPFAPARWHAHEMIFGVLGAAVAGFLLTAVPNWTGRLPLQGWPLIGLFALWLAGRIVMAVGAGIGASWTAAVDLSFLAVLLVVILREIAAGKNWRNLPVAGALAALVAANAAVHAGVADLDGGDGFGIRLGLGVVAYLIALIGGRIIPSFTGNWLAKRDGEARPVAFNRFDGAVIVLTLAALLAWSMAPDGPVAGVLLLAAGTANAVRLARWRGWRTVAEPLIWSLHVGYLWLPVGLLLLGAAPFTAALPAAAGEHALGVGAMGGMILAVMTRATLGHTGRALVSDGWTSVVYAAGFAAAALRVAAVLVPDAYEPLLTAAAVAWYAAFGVFTLRYGAMMVKG